VNRREQNSNSAWQRHQEREIEFEASSHLEKREASVQNREQKDMAKHNAISPRPSRKGLIVSRTGSARASTRTSIQAVIRRYATRVKRQDSRSLLRLFFLHYFFSERTYFTRSWIWSLESCDQKAASFFCLTDNGEEFVVRLFLDVV